MSTTKMLDTLEQRLGPTGCAVVAWTGTAAVLGVSAWMGAEAGAYLGHIAGEARDGLTLLREFSFDQEIAAQIEYADVYRQKGATVGGTLGVIVPAVFAAYKMLIQEGP